MTREALDLEFLGAEYDCGFSYGVQPVPLTEAAVLVAAALERALTPTESLAFAEGWHAGQADRAAYLADMAGATEVVWDGVPY